VTGLLFFPPRGLLGRLIDTITHRQRGAPNVSHVAIVLNDMETAWIGVEAVTGGVRRFIIDKGHHNDLIYIPVDVDAHRLEAAATALVGARYDWLAYPALLAIGLLGHLGIQVLRNPFQARRKWFCSELAVHLYHRAGRTLPVGDAPAVTPQRLLNRLWDSSTK